jgi:hypothetical protein
VESESASHDEADPLVESLETGVGEAETDGGEDPVAVSADGAGGFDERFEPGALRPGAPAVNHVGGVGFVEVASLATDTSSEVVFGGFSLGALIAHKLAQTRPNAKGALLYHYGDVPMNLFAESWPPAVPVQFHISEHDEWREAGVVERFVRAVEATAPVQLFEYPGSAHLFTDSTSAEFDPVAAAQAIKRTISFLDNLS